MYLVINFPFVYAYTASDCTVLISSLILRDFTTTKKVNMIHQTSLSRHCFFLIKFLLDKLHL